MQMDVSEYLCIPAQSNGRPTQGIYGRSEEDISENNSITQSHIFVFRKK